VPFFQALLCSGGQGKPGDEERVNAQTQQCASTGAPNAPEEGGVKEPGGEEVVNAQTQQPDSPNAPEEGGVKEPGGEEMVNVQTQQPDSRKRLPKFSLPWKRKARDNAPTTV